VALTYARPYECIKALVDIHNIDCSFERLDAYTYTRSADDRRQIESEVEAASQLGLSASFTESVPGPFNVEAALQMPNQAQFNPTPYLRELAADLAGEGSYIFEGTKAMDLNTGQCPVVQTNTTSTRDRAGKNDSGYNEGGEGTSGAIQAEDVVIASHFPFYDPALYFARMYPKRSYLLAVQVEEASAGMCYQAGGPYDYRTLRPYPIDNGSGMLIG
jgi:glycine/D-amino acid oxidase-like deaminating enzyme